jgi:alpha-glucosidase
MVKSGVRFVVMAPTEMTTDVPEQRHMKNDPKTDWDKRARGLGGKITSCGEENLLNLKGDRYRNENILIHEFAHAIHTYGIGKVDKEFNVKLRATYKKAMDSGLWKDTYAATNAGEYWAEGVQSYFDCNAPAGGVHNDINTRERLAKYDPDLFALIDETFKQTPYRYVRYDRRKKMEK